MNGLELEELRTGQGGFSVGPVSLAIPSGTATVLLGPSGAGKTTLLRAIAGFLPLQHGEVLVDERPVGAAPPEARRFGFVPPNLGLFPQRRVRDNVRYPLELRGDPEADSKTDRWLARFGLEPLARAFPHTLSSGQRQRVAMARALAAEPRVLLWDEPLSALDVESRDSLIRLLRDLIESEAVPLLLVTHDPTTAFALASRVVVLEGGRIRADRTPEELARGPLDRFLARFLGYENLYTSAELAGARTHPLGALLADRGGAGGLAIPPDAIAWQPGPAGPHEARVAALRWTAAGWVVALRHGPLVLHSRVPGAVPGVRVGDTVTLHVDPHRLRPLENPTGEAAP